VFARSAQLYDTIYSFKDYAREAELVDELIQQRTPRAESLLDVACGTGKHLERLRSRYRCEGLDLDPALLAIARERCPDVPFHEGDMTSFDLGRRFDAVVCLFSAIGYARSEELLRRAIGTMATHLEPGGVLLVEPWLTPETFEERHVAAAFVDEPELKVARVNNAERRGRLSSFEFHYLVGTPDRVEHFTERHELGLFTHGEYAAALRAAGLAAEYDPHGLMGRGLHIGVRR
jgi:SAM-dependent methyltransferase